MGRPSGFDDAWAGKPDEQLFHALAHRDEYEPQAIEAVEREIARRNLDSRRISELEVSAAKEKQDQNVKAQMPLQWPFRILMLILAFGILQIMVGEYYRNRGYARRSREVWRWMLYGLLFWLAILLLEVLLSLI